MTDPAQQLVERGFITLDHVFAVDAIDALLAEYRRQFPDIEREPDQYPVGERRIQVTMKMAGPFLSPSLYANPLVLEIVQAVLGPDLLIDNFSLVCALPGAPEQHEHADHPDLFPGEPFIRAVVQPYAINVAIPLVDLTPETGTTNLFAGSHRRDIDPDDCEAPYLKRGSCYLADYRLSHFGTENRSADERPIVYLAYARSWFIDRSNYGDNTRIAIDRADLERIQREHRPLFRRLAAKGAFDCSERALFDA